MNNYDSRKVALQRSASEKESYRLTRKALSARKKKMMEDVLNKLPNEFRSHESKRNSCNFMSDDPYCDIYADN